ncbi:uncharacterized protein LOC105201917 [Solenopsis invicta]|uniref:uncharacterized protein LOC105201917 n=1 Tax=Solenopsis invicta TaxID=13686 RepID=UPI00059617BE|nr:uncharacterized protein LOC105201917 [Solenopsis invicta]
MEQEPPYGKDLYVQLCEREDEIHKELNRRKTWKRVIQAKRKRIKALETFVNQTSPINEEDEADEQILAEKERWKEKYNTIKNYYEDEDKYPLVDKFIIKDEEEQPHYEISVSINVKDIRKNKDSKPRECILNYKIRKQTAIRTYGLDKEFTEGAEPQLTTGEINRNVTQQSIPTVSTSHTAVVTNIRATEMTATTTPLTTVMTTTKVKKNQK